MSAIVVASRAFASAITITSWIHVSTIVAAPRTPCDFRPIVIRLFFYVRPTSYILTYYVCILCFDVLLDVHMTFVLRLFDIHLTSVRCPSVAVHSRWHIIFFKLYVVLKNL
jgi:hypothetical protein